MAEVEYSKSYKARHDAKLDHDFTAEELESEIWRDIIQLPGFQASSLGRIKGPGGLRRVQKHNKGYQFLVLSLPVHRLVCEAFHGPPPFEGAMTLHRPDHTKHNCRENNLRWGSAQENSDDMIAAGRANSPKGEVHGRAIMTQEIVDSCRERNKSGEAGYSLWKEVGIPLGLSKSAFYKMLQGNTWKDSL